MILSVEKLSFKYPNQSHYAIQNVTFQVKKGEWVAIVGHNGSGKSTIAKLLIGLLKPENGIIKLFNTVLNEETIWDIRKRVGMVFQNPDNQFVGTTVEDDVAFGLENNGVPREDMIKRVREAVQQVNMEEFLQHEPHHLSGGQKQRVAIAGIIALQPDLIILDEATSMLDPKGKQEVLETVRHLNKKQHITVLSITHDLEEVAKADRVIVMNKGEIMAEGTPKQIFSLGVKLERVGLDLPFAVKVSNQLKQHGLPLSSNYFTVEELVDELWTLYSSK
ncbi:energy-coupling factor ABC transporter ATP-binding protein [Thermaerobacillus caldiproteolyticus]|uniref:Energy-coupling factor transport system ATP-binding protein n=1 Tax=Thermaerobacillus caldiproteolyticus TaxID=247480 RepID=A0A7V9ZA91_9BACL|nr:energy-coupling factor ABC transporter ATP-binding protein [Anoxybacillus caldiproteolyticus]MBA2876948.1 energy-coupling factor transport system ATP-binding protein [Anoxybacillus caldiproteolyticus]QPA31087.1 energy-coupling factor ABC transporter ATP-binding protein [Anoxybacillus caldiproteolyticus]